MKAIFFSRRLTDQPTDPTDCELVAVIVAVFDGSLSGFLVLLLAAILFFFPIIVIVYTHLSFRSSTIYASFPVLP